MIDGFMYRRRLKRILSSLEAERKMILVGAYDDIAKIIETRETQISEIENLSEDIRASLTPLLIEIRAKSDRNRGLLKQALAGLAKSRAFIHEITEARQKLRTYTQTGNSVDVAPNLRALSRKA